MKTHGGVLGTRLRAFLLAGVAAAALSASGQEAAAAKAEGDAESATPRQLEARASRMPFHDQRPPVCRPRLFAILK